MGTTADKLNLLLNSKKDIKAALTEMGRAPSDVFSTYADEIRAIQSGSITATDDGAGNVTITISGATATYSDGNVTIA